jgi:hypothetical protein
MTVEDGVDGAFGRHPNVAGEPVILVSVKILYPVLRAIPNSRHTSIMLSPSIDLIVMGTLRRTGLPGLDRQPGRRDAGRGRLFGGNGQG